MSTNLYFNNVTSHAEQELVNDLTSEVIKIHGMDLFYIPRSIVKEDLILGEDVLAKFSTAYEIEMYLKGTEGFGGEGDLVSKFGLDVRDEVIFTVHKDRFNLATDMDKPLEGDLIFLPINKGLFEIKFVEHEQPFYQAGKNYSFDITCELFQYSEEQMQTGIVDVDQIEKDESYAIDLVMSAGGSGLYTVNEEVYQGPSLANSTFKGIVVSWNATTRTLRLNDISGSIAAVATYGDTSSAVWSLSSTTDSTGKADLDQVLPTDSNADNLEFEIEADSILDFSESNPFGDVR
ncbi:uncharacterized protein METZ01_LOCUS168317 [marine metagenome]|uniref:Neck protein n=1 Tax=marine metagenome TaxID=408172 RepID=A0A382BQV2_9ZZZZ